MWSSRSLASQIIVYANTLTNILLPNLDPAAGNVNATEAADILNQYKASSVPLQTATQTLVDGFVRVQGDLANFYQTYANFALNRTAGVEQARAALAIRSSAGRRPAGHPEHLHPEHLCLPKFHHQLSSRSRSMHRPQLKSLLLWYP